ncbi:MAG: hypothetical protein NTY90_05440 [Candidatus Micrarchaeota archaeon]|nr:hypothetical protein [Candidatus Micrarchaeota archaeon]
MPVRREMLAVLFVCVAFAVVLGYEVLSSLPLQFPGQPTGGCLEANQSQCPACPTVQPQSVTKKIDLRLPAVDRQKRGAFANLTVEMSPGVGKLFVRMDSDNPLVNPETQNSLRTAMEAARQATGASLSNKNFYYSIAAASDVVGGKSAGAAMAVATMALLKGGELRPDAVITGTIDENGTIGQVGEILAKAEAVKEAGYSLFLVPEGEGMVQKQFEQCEKTQQTVEGGVAIREVCHTNTNLVNVSYEVGIRVAEVKNLLDAYLLMKKA